MKLGACGAKVFTYYVYNLNLEYISTVCISILATWSWYMCGYRHTRTLHAPLKFPDSA